MASALPSPPMPNTRRPDLRNASADSVLRAASRTGSPVRMARAAIVPPSAPMPTISIRTLKPPIDAIHRGEVSHVREKHTGAHDIIKTLAGRLQNRREILEDALRLGHNAPSTTLPVAGSWATCPLKKKKPSILTAWENGPTGGASSGEVIAVLLIATPVATGLAGMEHMPRRT